MKRVGRTLTDFMTPPRDRLYHRAHEGHRFFQAGGLQELSFRANKREVPACLVPYAYIIQKPQPGSSVSIIRDKFAIQKSLGLLGARLSRQGRDKYEAWRVLFGRRRFKPSMIEVGRFFRKRVGRYSKSQEEEEC